MVIRTCDAEIEDSWLGKVTVVALWMADSYWSCALLREILGNITKTVSCAVLDLDNFAFDYSCYSLNGGDKGSRRTADEI